jgi:hypothetical protein
VLVLGMCAALTVLGGGALSLDRALAASLPPSDGEYEC